MKKLLSVAVYLSILLITSSAFAWGPTGHRVVGNIANTYLKNSVKRKVAKLLDGHSLARVANWPDKIKSDPDNYKHTYKWHYTDWPTEQHSYDPINNNGSLVVSIKDNLKVLRNKKAKKTDRAFALKFLVHLVGDLHMPLHVGNGNDRGGNNCRVVFHGNEMNLHQLWDAGLVQYSKLSYKELAKFVNVVKRKELRSLAKGSVIDWAKESKELRQTIYPQAVQVIGAEPVAPRNYCNKDLVLTTEQLPRLSYKYSYDFMPKLERRLMLAGIRLARLINESF
ncbi:MAG: hypothetical protein ACI9QD_000900 [Thermoproteota archaeon]|jgi:hypothetical protein